MVGGVLRNKQKMSKKIIEDHLKLGKETKKEIKQSQKEIALGKCYTFEQVKEKYRLS